MRRSRPIGRFLYLGGDNTQEWEQKKPKNPRCEEVMRNGAMCGFGAGKIRSIGADD